MKFKFTSLAFILLLSVFFNFHSFAQFKTISDRNPFPDKEELFKIAPNPAKENLKVLLNDKDNQQINISIFNVIGQTVLEQKFVDHPGDIILDLSGFQKGLYIINVKKNNWSSTEKFLIE